MGARILSRLVGGLLVVALAISSTGCTSRPFATHLPATTQAGIQSLGRIGVALTAESTELGTVRPPLGKSESIVTEAEDGANAAWSISSNGSPGAAIVMGALSVAMTPVFAVTGGAVGAVTGFTTDEIVAFEKLRSELVLQPALTTALADKQAAKSLSGGELTGVSFAPDFLGRRPLARLPMFERALAERLRARGFDTVLLLRPGLCTLRPGDGKSRGNAPQSLHLEIKGYFVRLHDGATVLCAAATYDGKFHGYRSLIKNDGVLLRQEWETGQSALAAEIARWLAPLK